MNARLALVKGKGSMSLGRLVLINPFRAVQLKRTGKNFTEVGRECAFTARIGGWRQKHTRLLGVADC